MKQTDKKTEAERAVTDRRGFLKLAGLGAVAGGASVATAAGVAEAAEAQPEGKGYRETEHVKAYYKLARF